MELDPQLTRVFLLEQVQDSDTGQAVVLKQQTEALAESVQPVLGQVGQLDVQDGLDQVGVFGIVLDLDCHLVYRGLALLVPDLQQVVLGTSGSHYRSKVSHQERHKRFIL